MAKKCELHNGDLFLVPSRSGRYFVGQLAEDLRKEVGVVLCDLFHGLHDETVARSSLDLEKLTLISSALITPESLERAVWPIVGACEIQDRNRRLDVCALRSSAFVGATIVGSGLVADYLDTYHGVLPISTWANTESFNRFFLEPPSARI